MKEKVPVLRALQGQLFLKKWQTIRSSPFISAKNSCAGPRRKNTLSRRAPCVIPLCEVRFSNSVVEPRKDYEPSQTVQAGSAGAAAAPTD